MDESPHHPLLAASSSGHGGDCGFCMTALKAGDNGTISSPNFPQPYPDT